MKKNGSSLLLLLTTVFFISSCSTSIEISKRRYNTGYYVHIDNNKPEYQKPSALRSRVAEMPVLTAEIKTEQTEKMPTLSLSENTETASMHASNKSIKKNTFFHNASAFMSRPLISETKINKMMAPVQFSKNETKDRAIKKMIKHQLSKSTGSSFASVAFIILGSMGFLTGLILLLDDELEIGLMAILLGAILLGLGIAKVGSKSSSGEGVPQPKKKINDGSEG